MRAHWLMFAALLGGCSTHRNDPLDPDAFPQYQSTVTVQSGERTNTFQYFRQGSKLRIVPVGPELNADGQPMDKQVIILDAEAKTATAISERRKQYYVRPLLNANMPGTAAVAQAAHKIVSRETVGLETVANHTCSVEHLTLEQPDGTQSSVKVWTAQDLKGFPMRVETARGNGTVTTTFADVKLGPAGNQSLFTVPADYTNAATH
jgi:hypothetical protein